jgi:hypothetical protein
MSVLEIVKATEVLAKKIVKDFKKSKYAELSSRIR